MKKIALTLACLSFVFSAYSSDRLVPGKTDTVRITDPDFAQLLTEAAKPQPDKVQDNAKAWLIALQKETALGDHSAQASQEESVPYAASKRIVDPGESLLDVHNPLYFTRALELIDKEQFAEQANRKGMTPAQYAAHVEAIQAQKMQYFFHGIMAKIHAKLNEKLN